MSQSGLTLFERRAALAIAGIFSFRMLGLFMIMPIFSLYAPVLEGYTPLLAGLAIGIYGLSQALLQIPLGMLSDRIGRRPVIYAGLLVFALGSVIAALAESMTWIIVGRVLQGAGAISSALMALAADVTREPQRLRAMAIIGMTIGLSFSLALIMGPLLAGLGGLSLVFWVTAGLALLGMLLLHWGVPQAPQRLHMDAAAMPKMFRQVVRDGQLLRLDLGVFTLHLVMTCVFVALPLLLADLIDPDVRQHIGLYVGVLLVSFVLMVPLILLAEKRQKMKLVFCAAIGLLILALLGLSLGGQQLAVVVMALLVFFTAFNVLEASLPSLVTKYAPVAGKGTALGVYASAQFLGAFCGGALAGALLHYYSIQVLFFVVATLVAIWWLLALSMQSPQRLASQYFFVDDVLSRGRDNLQQQLLQLSGVCEAAISRSGAVYLKVQPEVFDREAVQHILQRDT